MKLNCLIIDDEPIARKIISEYIADIDFLDLAGEAANPVKASAILTRQQIDVVFLDIEMPKLNGIEFLKNTPYRPATIMTTAFPQYALEGYELDVLDYLVKPISFARFLKACNKAKHLYERSSPGLKQDADHFFIKCDNRFERILFEDVLFIEAANNYIYIQTRSRKLISYLTFKGVEEQLPAEQFIRVHKSFIVSLTHIDHLNSETIGVGGHTIPISRNLKDEVMERVVNSRLLRR